MIASRFPTLLAELRRALGDDNLLANHAEMVVYECDGSTIEKNCPDVVCFPRHTADVQTIVRLCNEYDVPYLPRGAGTSLAGGCLPVDGGVLIVFTRMKAIEEINLRDRALLRSRSNRVIGGVCAGLAAYLGLDARLVRIVWVIASLSTVGLGVMLYILALIVIPEAPAEEAVTPSNSTVI